MSCNAGPGPNSVTVDARAVCQATVTDTEDGITSTPTGTVSFDSSGGGSFGADSCTLRQDTPGVAVCEVTYTPSAAGSQTIGAAYGGDSTHTQSNGSRALSVEARSARTTVGCAPDPVATGRQSTCTATVTDTSSGTASTPTGTVGFALDSGPGNFDSDACTLSQTAPGVAACSVTYTSSAVGTGEMFVQYGGDAKHAGTCSASASAR